MSLLKRWFDFFHRRRDGSSPAAAIPVASIPDEYLWIMQHYPDFNMLRQDLVIIHGQNFDVLVLETPDGLQKSVYFRLCFEPGHGL